MYFLLKFFILRHTLYIYLLCTACARTQAREDWQYGSHCMFGLNGRGLQNFRKFSNMIVRKNTPLWLLRQQARLVDRQPIGF